MEFRRVVVVDHRDQQEQMDQMVCLLTNLQFKTDIQELCRNGLHH